MQTAQPSLIQCGIPTAKVEWGNLHRARASVKFAPTDAMQSAQTLTVSYQLQAGVRRLLVGCTIVDPQSSVKLIVLMYQSFGGVANGLGQSAFPP